MTHHKESVFFFAAVVAGDGDIALRLLIFYIRFRKRKVHLYMCCGRWRYCIILDDILHNIQKKKSGPLCVAGDGDIALQGEDRTARAPGPLTLRQYEIAAFLNMSRQ